MPTDALRHGRAQILKIHEVQLNSSSQPRMTSGIVTIAGAVMAGFGAFSLWQMRVEERAAVRQAVRKRVDSVASSSDDPAYGAAGDDPEAYYPHERRGSGVN